MSAGALGPAARKTVTYRQTGGQESAGSGTLLSWTMAHPHTHQHQHTHTQHTHTHTHTHTQCMYECMAQYTHGKEKVTMFLCMCVYRSVRFVAQLNRRDQLLLANASPTLAARARCVSFYPSWSLSIYLSIYLSIHAPAHFTTAYRRTGPHCCDIGERESVCARVEKRGGPFQQFSVLCILNNYHFHSFYPLEGIQHSTSYSQIFSRMCRVGLWVGGVVHQV